MVPSAAEEEKSSPSIPPANPSNPAVEDPAVKSVLRRWKIEEFLGNSALILRGLAWIFSALAFVTMASNRHGDWRNFDKYEEYRYLLAVSILAFFYTTAQLVRKVPRSSGGSDILPARTAATVDFAGDQIAAYLLMSGVSAAAPITNRMREGVTNSFTDTSAAAIAMAFFAFATLALSALVSGFKLARHNYG